MNVEELTEKLKTIAPYVEVREFPDDEPKFRTWHLWERPSGQRPHCKYTNMSLLIGQALDGIDWEKEIDIGRKRYEESYAQPSKA